MATAEGEQSVWQGFKGFVSERFRILDSYRPYIRRDTPLPSWSDADVQEFIASDPVHGPVLKTTRNAVKFLALGGVVGAVSTASFAWKYSKSPHGAALALGAGAVFGMSFGQEIANHSLQLYKLDTMAAQAKYMEWWQKKSEGRY
ncbi:succinate dehydrogenase subunit 6, mitochondrial [Rutidosis leptorrhynchoides]|uniref:succinate dehydrogenase subunit 6, mitochondrial n=1 Tax=Rutidosis leptorrhynchoides TaxID=125765 RepID=UPI003A996898